MEASRFSTPRRVRSPLRGGVISNRTGAFFRLPPRKMLLMLILMISASLSSKWWCRGTGDRRRTG